MLTCNTSTAKVSCNKRWREGKHSKVPFLKKSGIFEGVGVAIFLLCNASTITTGAVTSNLHHLEQSLLKGMHSCHACSSSKK